MNAFTDKDITTYLKILALAENSPEGGERAAAQRLLDKMEAKHPGLGAAARTRIRNATPRTANTAAGTPEGVWRELGIDPAMLVREGGKLLLGMLTAWAASSDRDVERFLSKVKADVAEGGTPARPRLELVLSFPISTFTQFLETATEAQLDAACAGLTATVKELWLDAIALVADEDDDEDDEDDDESA